METRGLHPGLERRLEDLANRIASLRTKMNLAKGIQKIEDFGEIAQLEHRYKRLEERLQSLNREGPGFRQDMKAEVEKVADDLTANIENFMTWLDSGGHPDRRPKQPRDS